MFFRVTDLAKKESYQMQRRTEILIFPILMVPGLGRFYPQAESCEPPFASIEQAFFKFVALDLSAPL
jgi:hypothetical protein